MVGSAQADRGQSVVNYIAPNTVVASHVGGTKVVQEELGPRIIIIDDMNSESGHPVVKPSWRHATIVVTSCETVFGVGVCGCGEEFFALCKEIRENLAAKSRMRLYWIQER